MDMADIEKVMAAALDDMAKLTGMDRKAIILAEAGVILKTCAARTPVLDSSKIEQRARRAAIRGLGLTGAKGSGDVTMNIGMKGKPFGRVWARSNGPKSNGKFRLAMGPGGGKHDLNHWTDSDWSRIKSSVADVPGQISKQTGLIARSAGLARQSWIQIADKLGIKLETVKGGGQLSARAIKQAREATASSGRRYDNGMGTQEQDADKFFARLTNNLPFGNKLHFSALLELAIAGRIQYFATNLQKGVFDSMETVAKRYRNFHISQ
jgi:hypothetical protein